MEAQRGRNWQESGDVQRWSRDFHPGLWVPAPSGLLCEAHGFQALTEAMTLDTMKAKSRLFHQSVSRRQGDS